MINLSNVSKSFGSTIAINNISLNANKGELFGIVGPDGAGKSTLMKILATTLEPDKGNYIINDTDVSKNLFQVREKIAYMPQKFGLYEDLSVEENIYFFAHLFSVSNNEIQKRIKRLYEFSRLEPFKNFRAGKLSGGMKQKLGLACSLIHKPDILLLDEPTNGVDPVSRREFWAILYDLLSEGTSIIISTAYLDEAERCSTLALMSEGKFITINEPLNIKNSITQEFICVISNNPIKLEKTLVLNFNNIVLTRIGNTLKFFLPHDLSIDKIKLIIKKRKLDILKINKINPSLEDCFLELLGQHKNIKPKDERSK